jgi:D-glycero-alpha-D-manno-heptose-7-phosphate kinase
LRRRSADRASPLRAWNDVAWDLAEIAEEGRTIEVEDLHCAGGRQDHYAATHGGALGLRFTDVVDVERVTLPQIGRSALERRALIVYTGESRISGDTITAVIDKYLSRDRRVLVALERMKELAEQMARELATGDIDDLGAMVHEHWVFQRQLDPAIPTPLIDHIVATAMKAGASGCKALGASGGGCVLVIARDDTAAQVQRAVASLGTILPFHVDLDGLALV